MRENIKRRLRNNGRVISERTVGLRATKSFACNSAVSVGRVLGCLQAGSCKRMDEDTASLLQREELYTCPI